MADELNKNAEFSGKHKDEEDPILTAQRYLNIYHQIHIFNERRQKEFDDSLLKMPSDIRVLLSTLPGGSMLLDYITQLEEKRGISLLSESEKETIKESKNKNLKNKKRDEENSKNTKEIDTPASVLRMFKQSEEKHDKDMRILTDAFIQSQTNMANILKDILQNNTSTSKSDEKKKSKKEKINSNKSEKWLKTEEPETSDIIEETVDNNNNEQQDTKAQTEALAKVAAEALIKAEIQQQQNAEASKLFSLTKRIFNSIKERRNMREGLSKSEDQEEKIFNADTPASLNEINDEPISLNKDEIPHPQLTSDKNENENENENESNIHSKDKKEETPDEDWEWEYVDDDSSDDDSEWEYIEVPEDEPQPVSQDTAELQTESTLDSQLVQTQDITEQPNPQTSEEQTPLAAQNPYPQVYDDNQAFYYPQENYMPYDANQDFYNPNTSDQTYPYQNYEQAYDTNYEANSYEPTLGNTYTMSYPENQLIATPMDYPIPESEALNNAVLSSDLPQPQAQTDNETIDQSQGIESSASLLARFVSLNSPNEDNTNETTEISPDTFTSENEPASDISLPSDLPETQTKQKTEESEQQQGIESSASLLAHFMSADTSNEDDLNLDDINNDISDIIESTDTSDETSLSKKDDKKE